MQKKRAVVIGIDGLGWELLNPLLEAGEMPNLKKAISKGISSELISIIPPSSGPSWTSFATGKDANSTGCHDYLIPKANLKDFKTISSREIKGRTFYEIIESKNLEPIVINLPNSWPPRLKKGITITCLLTRGKDFIFPKILKQKIPELKDYKILPNEILEIKGDVDKYLHESIDVEETRFKCAKKLFRMKWDFFFVLFNTLDGVQHKRYDKMLEFKDPVALQLLRNLDSYVGWFMKNLPKECSLIIMSDHAFRDYKGIFYINKWLEQEGFLKTTTKSPEQELSKDLPETDRKQIDLEKETKITLNVGGLLRKLFYNKLLHSIASFLYRKIAHKFVAVNYKLYIDFDNSKAIRPAQTTASYLYINDSRFNGPVKSKIEKEKIISEIINGLKGLKDSHGNYVIKNARRAREVYKGDIPNNFPDIVIEMEDYIIYPYIFPPAYIEEKGQNSHFPDGIVIFYGNNIKDVTLNKPRIIDIAPTILKLMNIKVPKWMDGKALDIIKTMS